jgi:hypothetical protein
MTSARGAAVGIGRVGALALALGIGAAVTGGVGAAWADTDNTGSSEQTSASNESPSTSSGPARRAARAAAPARTGTDSGPAVNTRNTSALPRAAAAQRPAKDDVPASTPARVGNDVTPSAGSATPTVSRPAVSPAATLPLPVAAIPAPAATPSLDATAPAPAVVPAVVTPDAPVAVAAPQVSVSAPPRAARLLSAVGLAPLAGSTIPGGAVDSPALWALLGWARRDMGRAGVRSAAAHSALPSATVAAAVVTTPSTLSSRQRGWVTGQRNTAFPGSGWQQVNNTQWANIYGTDLGIMWFNGDNGLTQLAFGDTFSRANMTGDWRSNVLLLSDDTNLTDGLSLINTGPAFQFIPAARNQVFFIGSEVTNIPTSAVYANGENYVNYMSVKSWDTPGRWTTNYSAISMYDEATDKWVLQKNTVRSAGWFRSSTPYRAGDQNFQMMAYVLEPESKVAEGEARYLYAFGTPAGRAGSAYLSRVPEAGVTDLSQYEYWDGDSWVDRQAEAAPIIGDSTKSGGLFGWIRDIANNPNFFGGWFAGLTGAKTGGNVSEMSVQYNEYLDKYVVLYGNGANNVILRTADTPEGPWSDPITIATSATYPGLYAPMIHPLSGTGQLTDSNGDPDISNLYWNMSIWSNYNVVLMQTDLSQLIAV